MLDALKPFRVLSAKIRILNSKCDAGAGGGAWCDQNFQQLFSIVQLAASSFLLHIGFCWSFFLVVCLFFSSSPGMPFQMASHCRGWGQASPAKRSTWTRWKVLSNNKQTNRQVSASVKTNDREHNKRESSDSYCKRSVTPSLIDCVSLAQFWTKLFRHLVG